MMGSYDDLLGQMRGESQAAKANRSRLLEGLAAEKGAEPERSNYEWFLDLVLTRRHPDYCRIIWDGEQPLIQFTVPFQRHSEEDPEIVSKRAYRYFRRYSTYEQKVVRFELVYSSGRLSHAVVSVRPEAAGVVRLGTTRLKELAEDPRPPTSKQK